MDIIELQNPLNRFERMRSYIEVIRNFRVADKVLAVVRQHGPLKYDLPAAPDEVLAWNPDLIHFPTQYGFRTNLPNIYQPHDLQHLHFPENFSRENLVIRDIGYSNMIHQASKVVVGNEWTVNDVIRFFPEKKFDTLIVPVFPQPLNAPTGRLDPVNAFGDYFFYPAGDWPHKNHFRLLHAFKTLIDSSLKVNLVLTGVGVANSSRILSLIQDLGIKEYVFVLGYVTEVELAEIYLNAQCVVIPSLFESESLPIWEAFAFDVPVIASRTTAIPNQVGEAAILFDPDSVLEISAAMKTILTDCKLRKKLVAEGAKRLSKLTPSNTTRGYRYTYRQALGLPRDKFDEEWLSHGFRF